MANVLVAKREARRQRKVRLRKFWATVMFFMTVVAFLFCKYYLL